MDAVPPALRYRLRETLRSGSPVRFARLLDEGVSDLGADPALAEIGQWLIDARRDVELQQCGCRWLSLFPTVDSVTRLAAVAADAGTPAPVREQAIRALGDRQLCARHPATQWSPAAVQIADEALVKIGLAASAAGTV